MSELVSFARAAWRIRPDHDLGPNDHQIKVRNGRSNTLS